MKAETLLELMESKQYESLTVSEFAQIVRNTMNDLVEDEREAEEVQDEAYDRASSNRGELI